MKACHVR